MKSTRACAFEGCDRLIRARGLCAAHWTQQNRGQELRPLRSQITVKERFWSKVNKNAPGGCWEWTGATGADGYGHIWVNARVDRAHRVSWEWVNGLIPTGVQLDHRCHHRRCVNPEHLRPVNRSQNGQHRAGAPRNSTSGVRGVSWKKQRKAWRVEVTVNGRKHWGGYHSTLEAADAAARALRADLYTHDDHDEWLKQD